jgi:pumilio family protein 6
MWERLRVKKISAVDKRALVVSIFKACVGKVPDLANNHKGSRVIQALLKYGTKEEVAAIYGECTPQIAMLAKSLYGHFIVKKLVNPLNPKP